MTGLPSGTRIWLAAGITAMRAGMNGLAAKVETALTEDPYCGHLFMFRGRRGDMLKVLWWSGDGLCLLAKRLQRGRFVWPQATSGTAVRLMSKFWMSGEVRYVREKHTAGSRPCGVSGRRLSLATASVASDNPKELSYVTLQTR